MGLMSNDVAKGNLQIRAFSYGPPKTGKTGFMASASKAGFNVYVLDSDRSADVLAKADLAKYFDLSKIVRFDIADSPNRQTTYDFYKTLLERGHVLFDEVTKTPLLGVGNTDNPRIGFDLAKLGRNDVLLVDSWTTIVSSIQDKYNVVNKIDVFAAARDDREFYAWCGRIATRWLNALMGLPCHVCMTGHEELRELRGKNAEGKEIVKSTRVQPISVSRNHSGTLAGKFTDVLYHTVDNTGKVAINTRPEGRRDGGSRTLPNGQFPIAEMQFSVLAESKNVVPDKTVSPLHAVDLYEAGEEADKAYVSPVTTLGNAAGGSSVAPIKPVKKGDKLKAGGIPAKK